MLLDLVPGLLRCCSCCSDRGAGSMVRSTSRMTQVSFPLALRGCP